MKLLEVDGLTFGFGSGRPVLRELTFSASDGERLGIVGANGAGKSTLLWCLAGLYRTGGRVRIFGKPPGASRARIGFVFQNPEDQLFMPSILEDVALPLVNLGAPRGTAVEKAAAALAAVGLAEHTAQPARRLSLGQRKRAAIAAALAPSPDLLILDEPTAELDGRSVRQLCSVLNGLEVTRLIASHDIAFLRAVTSRVIVLVEGRIAADGPSRDVLADTALMERAGLI